uniref:Uncharacterized protein n=1 Tax=Arundo donax TaxID=35708 RepID=A0A0A9HI48_ARUDO
MHISRLQDEMLVKGVMVYLSELPCATYHGNNCRTMISYS